ncbi:ankyrin repeat domain-containing protein [Streptomyces sediminimaris]|uniref:ankyrin repeat domain-containing protein n=1 Tax=Streptomyces sediminimaris TaxID=3383721 RepID=UPI00399C07AD
MSDSLPERPDLGQLRRQAKELRDAARRGDTAAVQRFDRHHPSRPDATGLAAAQLVIARELGFASWPRLKAAVDAHTASCRQERAFVAASVEHRVRQAADLFRADPGIARGSLRAAAVLGEAGAVHEILATDPTAAIAIDEERGWPPLLYACYSRWHQIDPGRVPGMAEVVRLLLDAGAGPNTNDGGRPRYRSALRGSVEANNPALTEVLLDAGAHPDPGQPIAEAARHRDHRCLELLLSHGARVAGTWAVGAAVGNDDPVATALLLTALEPAAGGAGTTASQALPDAAAGASAEVVAALLEAGADPRATGADGLSAHRLAVRAGNDASAALLRACGARDDSSAVDRFLGACLTADCRAAEELLADHPGLRDQLTDQDRAVLVDAASRRPEALALMLGLGFAHDVRNDSGEQPLHTAAYHGNAAAVRLLLDAGAEVDARDARFDGTPLAFATVGSAEQAGTPGDWFATVRLLLDAGASREGVWLAGKPPSEEVMDLLRSYGVTPDAAPPDEATEQPADERTDSAEPLGAGVLGEVARHLDAACRDRDLDLLASLLHPEVHWTGVCHDRAQVLAWYRQTLADGTTPTLDSVEIDRDAVVLGLTLTRPAEGARPAPPQRIFQVFTVDGAQIVDIRGYPDRRSALART